MDTAQDQIINGKMYVIVLSDNGEREYPDEDVPPNEAELVQIIGRAIQRSGEL